MSRDETDRRVRRTRHLLQEACIELILEKGYYEVTVQDILDRSDIGRSTFYAHYRDKDDLISSHFEHIHTALEQHIRLLPTYAEGGEQSGSYTDLLLVLLKYVEQEHRLLKALLGRQSNGTQLKNVRDTFLKVVTRILKENFQAKLPAYQLDAIAHYMVNAFLTLVVWWLDEDLPCSVEDLYSLMLRLVNPGLADTLGLPHGQSM